MQSQSVADLPASIMALIRPDCAVIRKILAQLGLAHSGQSPGTAPAAPSAAAP